MSEILIKHIKSLIPLCDIKKEGNLNDLFKNIMLGKMPADKTLFHSGDNNEFTYYLLSGQLILTDTHGTQTLLKSEDPECRFPVGYDQSNKYTVQTKTSINYLKINSQTLDVLLTWDQTTTPLIRSPERDKSKESQINWMSKILELELFQRIPPTNIQAMFLRFESIPVKKDEIIIQQDSEASYFYVIKSGSAAVYRSEGEDDTGRNKLAELGPGDAFGEDALVANQNRNATVAMIENGELARLAKDDFNTLLKEPIMKSIAYPEAQAMLTQGARLIDVRTSNEHEHNQLPNSLNLPLNTLREALQNLDNKHSFIVYCDTGSRSAAACFILNEHGYDAYLLENGLKMVPPEIIQHPKQN